jgi:hypothetical protein
MGSWTDCLILQNEAKNVILTIGKVRNDLFSENTIPTKISGFFPIVKGNLYETGYSYTTIGSVKAEKLKSGKSALAHLFAGAYFCIS